MADLYVRCVPEGENVRCAATAYNVGGIASRDVTSKTTWTASPVYGSFVEPGLFAPTSRGETTITGRFETFSNTYPPSFLVGPGEPARQLFYVTGSVKDAATGSPVVGAAVRIESGHSTGKSAVTNDRGFYTVERVLTSETFTITASKEGYQPLTKSGRGDTSGGFSAAYVNFELNGER